MITPFIVMEIQDLEKMCERSALYAFDLRKSALSFAVLAALGLLIIFSMGLSLSANRWIATSLIFLPVFISGGALLALGTILTRMYHDQIKHREVPIKDVLLRSWDVALSGSYIFVPIILTYLLLWILLGLFCLLREIPFIGDFFGILFAFGPFLLNVCALCLCFASIFILFSLTPVLALKNVVRQRFLYQALEHLKKRVFLRLILLAISVIPVLFVLFVLVSSAYLTSFVYVIPEKPLQLIMHWFFVMLPFTAILTPAVSFFFHMAAETHIYLQKMTHD